MPAKIALPVDAHLPALMQALERHSVLVVRAAPGAGKTTRVPAAMIETIKGGVLVLEPRRLAASLSAVRVAEERDEEPGQTVGYQIRFERVASDKTRLLYVTEGLFLRRLVAHPHLQGIAAVVLDEFHERNLHTDLALMLVRRLQKTLRPDLKLVIMSATLDTSKLEAWLGGEAAVFDIPGRTFPVQIEYLREADERALEGVVRWAAEKYAEQLSGHTLVFLPGMAQIQRAADALAGLAHERGWLLRPLHAQLPARDQKAALAPAAQKKIILTTNIAETSLTIPGVESVIDSGLARQVHFSPWSGLPSSSVDAISRASCEQRAGRAGRTAPGFCLRLYTKSDFDRRAAFDASDIQKSDLAQVLLEILAAEGGDRTDFSQLPWFEAPPPAAMAAAEKLLRMLGALEPGGGLSPRGRTMAAIAAHPRLARILVGAAALSREAALAVAMLSEGWQAEWNFDGAAHPAGSDLWFHLRSHLQRRGRGLGDRIERAAQQYEALIPRETPKMAAGEEDFDRLILSAFADRVAARRSTSQAGNREARTELLMSDGGSAELAPSSVAHHEDFVACLVAEGKAGRGGRTLVRVASAVKKDWLFDFGVSDEHALEWSKAGEGVSEREALRYGSLVLDENLRPAPASEACEEILADNLRASWPRPFGAEDLALALNKVRRLAFARAQQPGAAWPAAAALPVDTASIGAEEMKLLRRLCAGCRSFADLSEVSLADRMDLLIEDPQLRREVERVAPSHIELPPGRRLVVHYDEGKAPWVEGRLQEFFGRAQLPKIAGGSVALTIHLLAPNYRPVQVTSDLAGFWQRHYPALRREFARLYPKHSWPENPLTAQPPPMPKRRK